MLIKARYIKDGEPKGRDYTFSSDIEVSLGDQVVIGHATAIVTSLDVLEEEVDGYRDKIKKIDKKVEEE